MAWIESHQALQRHRKTIRAANLLKISRPLMIGHLHCLWWWALDNADSNGRIGVVSAAELAEAAEWPVRNSDLFTHALHDAGFIDIDADGAVSLHDWYDYAGKLMDRRTANAERMRDARTGRGPLKEAALDPARVGHVQRTFSARAPATQPDPTGPNRTGHNQPQPGPEEQQPEGESGAAAPPAAAAEPAAGLFTSAGWGPTTEQLSKLRQIAEQRGLDLELEAMKITDWLASPKARHGTKQQVCTFRFVAGWLEREQTNGSNGHGENRQRPGGVGQGPRRANAGAGGGAAGEVDPFAKYVRSDEHPNGTAGGP